jgi:hypothetical protein
MAKNALTKEQQNAAFEAFGDAVRFDLESHAVQITCLDSEVPAKVAVALPYQSATAISSSRRPM